MKNGLIKRLASLLLASVSVVALCSFPKASADRWEPYYALVCQKEEHTHSDSCYEERLVCGLEESDEHTHTAECYQKVLVCEKEEHTHDFWCHSNMNADRESKEDWDAFFCNFQASGSWGRDVVSVALSQEGYSESRFNFIMDQANNRYGYTRYADWYNRTVYTDKDEWWYMTSQYEAWCASFASFCLCYAGVPREAISWGCTCASWQIELREKGLLDYRHDGYYPNPGDIVFFSHERNTLADHVGIVKGVDWDRRVITVIEGNNTQTVEEFNYKINDENIFAYCNVGRAQSEWESSRASAKKAVMTSIASPEESRKNIELPMEAK